MSPEHIPKEGELYKVVTVGGKLFHIYYGYYEDFEREHHEPMPIYPDFLKEPEHTEKGVPILTAMQDACPNYRGLTGGEICQECTYYRHADDLFGLCACPANQKPQ